MGQMMRDYDLVKTAETGGPAHGLVSPKWYQTPVDRQMMKQLLSRQDARPLRDIVIYYLLMAGAAATAISLMPSWLSVPFWLIYGVLYTSGSDARWHECGHGTAFKTAWLNRFVYHLACFMIMRNPVTWKWSHARHHTDTLLVGRDAEIAVMVPPAALRLVLNLVGIPDSIDSLKRMAGHVMGRLQADEALYVPEHDQRRAFSVARVWLVVYLLTGAAAIGFQSVIPLLVIGGPRLYGAWHFTMTGYLQHGGLRDNVTDHRLNTRTVMMNPFSRFIYLNMNYHIEHHMFPLVPYYNLPRLHKVIKDDLPPPSRSIVSAYREMLPVVWQQLNGKEVFVERILPRPKTDAGLTL